MTGRGCSSRTALVTTRPPNSKPRHRGGGCGRRHVRRAVHRSNNEFIFRTVRSMLLGVLVASGVTVEFRTRLGSPRSSEGQPRLGNLLGQRNRGREFRSLGLGPQCDLRGQRDPRFIQLHSLRPPVHILGRPKLFRNRLGVRSLLFSHSLLLKQPVKDNGPEFPRGRKGLAPVRWRTELERYGGVRRGRSRPVR